MNKNIYTGRIVNVSKEVIDETVHVVGFKGQKDFRSFGWGHANGYGGITIYGKRQNYVCFKCVIYTKNGNQTIEVLLRDEILDYFSKSRITDKMINELKIRLESKKTKFIKVFDKKDSYNTFEFVNFNKLIENN